MISILAAVAQSAFFRVEGRIEAAVARAKRNAIALALTGVLLTTAYVIAVVAACIALSERYGAVAGLFGLAGALAALALIVIAVLMILNRRDKHIRAMQRRQTQTRRDLMALAATAAGGKPLVSAAIALAAGFLLAPRRKRTRERD